MSEELKPELLPCQNVRAEQTDILSRESTLKIIWNEVGGLQNMGQADSIDKSDLALRSALTAARESLRVAREALESAAGVLAHVGCCDSGDTWKRHAEMANIEVATALAALDATKDKP